MVPVACGALCAASCMAHDEMVEAPSPLETSRSPSLPVLEGRSFVVKEAEPLTLTSQGPSQLLGSSFEPGQVRLGSKPKQSQLQPWGRAPGLGGGLSLVKYLSTHRKAR